MSILSKYESTGGLSLIKCTKCEVIKTFGRYEGKPMCVECHNDLVIHNKKLVDKTVKQAKHQLNPNIILIPKGSEFEIDGNVFRWENNSSGGITLIGLPVVRHIEVEIGFQKI